MNTAPLKEIKNIAVDWLRSPVMPCDTNISLPGMVQHPFFDFVFVCDEKGPFDMQKEPERFETVLKMRERKINQQKTVCGILSLMRKAYRIYFLKEIYELELADEKTCGNALGEIWAMLENNDSMDEETKDYMLTWLLNADKNIIMNKDDLRVYNNLSDQITVYRGIQPNESVNGFSWSLCRETADWFAQRFEPKGNVYSITVDKKDVIAYINTRDEKEIVVDYTKIKDPILVINHENE